MPVRADPAAGPQARVLVDAAGRTLARFHAIERPQRPVADLLEPEPDAPAGRVAEALARELAGWRVVVPPPLAELLVGAGATRHRHARAMSRALHDLPATWGSVALTGVAVGPLERRAEDLLEARLAAYPPGHVDHHPERDADPAAALAELAGLMGGSHGALLPASRLALDAVTGAVLGAALVGAPTEDMPPPLDGPWLLELFRVPGRRGVGALLLKRALHELAAAGHATLGLSVTEGNPALELYERLDFATVWSAVAVDL